MPVGTALLFAETTVQYCAYSMMIFSFARRVAFSLVIIAMPLQVLAQTPDDPYLDDAWYLDAIAAPAAWDVTTGSSTIIVAVLDTGLDLDHEDIAGNVWTNTREIAENGVDDDGNGFVDDVHGWDFIENDNDPSPGFGASTSSDVASHGTLVAGQIGAVGNNALGYSGVNWDVQLMPVRMLDDQGGGTEHDAANAIRYALRNGAKVINLSFAGNEAHTALQNAVKDAFTNDVVIVAALGNEARDTDLDPVYPACLRGSADDWVIGVTASDEDDRGASFTNFGRSCADVAAPGTNVYGLGYEDGTARHADLYVGPWNGTSMASPLVAGAAALLFAEFPSLSASDVRNILKLSVDPIRIDGYLTGELGAGRLNIARALELAAAYAPASETVDSVASDDAASNTSDSVSTPAVDSSIDEDSVLQYSFVAFGAPAGVEPTVRMYRANGAEYASFAAYASNFRGGVHVTTLNYDEDLMIPEIVTGAGEGGGPHVRVFSATGSLIQQFFAYDPSSSRGVFVATGDVDGDEIEEIVTSIGSGVSQDIVAWTANGEEVLRFAADRFPASSALEVTTLDYDDDYAVEFAVTGIIDGVAHVALYDNDGTYLVDFVPYVGATSISVTGADRDGDSRDSVLVSSRTGTRDLREFTTIGALIGMTTLYHQALTGNSVGAVELDMDGQNDLIAFENVDGGMITMMSSDAVTILGSWRAPTFGGVGAPFFTVW